MIRFCQRYAMAPADVTRREPGAARQWVRIVRSGWKLSVRPNYRAPSAERRGHDCASGAGATPPASAASPPAVPRGGHPSSQTASAAARPAGFARLAGARRGLVHSTLALAATALLVLFGGLALPATAHAQDNTILPGTKVTLQLSDDATLELAPVTVTATVSPASPVAFTVTISATPVAPATAGDFRLSTNRVLSFAADATESTGTVTITPVDDDIPEPHDVVRVSGAVSNAAIEDPDDVTLSIINDDPEDFDVAVDAPAAVDEDAGAAVVTLTLTTRRNTAPVADIDLYFIGQPGETATRGDDYTPPPGVDYGVHTGVLFDTVQPSAFSPNAAGTAWVAAPSFTIGIIDDQEDERDETIVFALRTYGDETPAHTITIRDNDAATVTSVAVVSAPESGDTYRLYETMRFAVTFSHPVKVDKPGPLRLEVGLDVPGGGSGSTVQAVFSGQSSSPTVATPQISLSRYLHFHYKVQLFDRDADGVRIGANALRLASEAFAYKARIRSEAGTDAELDHAAVGPLSGHKVDGSADVPEIEGIEVVSTPRLLSRGADEADTYGEDEIIRIEVRFDDPVQVEGEPTFALEVGDPCVSVCKAHYESGSGTDTLVFAYLVLEVDHDHNGIAIPADPIEVVYGDSIRNDAGHGAHLSYGRKGTQPGHKTDGSRTAPSYFSVEDAEAHESDGKMEFTVRLEPHGLGIVTVDYATADGTGHNAARAGSDYTETSGTLRFNSLRTERTVSVPITDDAHEDDGETFTLTLSNPRGARLTSGDAEATGTIRNSEPGVALSAVFPASAFASASHGGADDRPQAVVAFSEAVAEFGADTPSVSVTGGTVASVQPHAEDGQEHAWIFFLAPDGDGAVTFALVADAACAAGGICTSGGKALTEVPAAATIPGPEETAEPALTASFEDMPAEHDGESKFSFRIAFSAVISVSYTTVRDASFQVTAGEVTAARRVDRRSDLWEITVDPASNEAVTIVLPETIDCDASGAICTSDGRPLSHALSATVAGPAGEPERNTAATGTPTIGGTPQVGEELTASTSGISDADGLDTASFGYQWIRTDTDIQGATGSTYTPVAADEGERLKVRVGFTDDAGNAERLTSAATDAVAARPEPLTASFVQAPHEHDGETAFKLRIAFSEGISISFRTFRDASFTVSGGSVTKAKRVDRRKDLWEVTVKPGSLGDVTVRLEGGRACGTAGAVCTGDGRALSATISTTVLGPAALSVADARVHEAEDALLVFEVTLDRARHAAVTVDYATSDVTARAGEDYTSARGTLTFATGERLKTVEVTVLDDAHDEGEETLTLTLSNPSGAYLADATATGTIENTDPMPKAWMVRFGRTVGSQVVDALNARLDGAGGSHVTVAGINLVGAPGLEPQAEDDDPFGLPEWAKNAEREAEARTITAEDIRLRSAFHLSSGGDGTHGGGPAFTAWGRVATGGFEAEEDDVAMDGDVTTGLVGFDAEWEQALAGIMFSQSSGDGSYRLDPAKGDDAGTVESSLTGVYPYANLDLNARVSAWALAGVGSGELTLKREGHRDMPTDISMRMGAVGVKGKVLDGTGASGVALNVKSDAMWVGTKSADTGELDPSEGDVTRLRFIVEGERGFDMGGGATFTPSAEVGLRHDGGDAETGTGVEVGAGLRYTVGAVTIEAQARTLLVHEASGYEDWGASGAIRVTPDASGRGLTLSIAPVWGRTGSAAERLWSARDARALGGDSEFEADSRLALDAGYGFGLAHRRGVLTPYAGLTLGDAGNRTVRTGTRWQGPDAMVALEGSRQASDAGEADNRLMLRVALRF